MIKYKISKNTQNSWIKKAKIWDEYCSNSNFPEVVFCKTINRYYYFKLISP